MADINGLFPSQWLKATDLKGGRATVRMAGVSIEKVGEDKKPVLAFQGTKKRLVLNVTNARAIAEITGSTETDEWRGRQIALVVTKVEYQGKRQDGIRVDYPNTAPSAPAPVLAPVPPPMPIASDDDSDQFADINESQGDDIPF
jgi:hypothetical protein